MARYNEILTGRHNRFMQKLFSMKGDPPAPQLSSELQMVHPIFHGVENRFLESWNRFSAGVVVAGAATFLSILRLRNPISSGVIAVVEKLAFATTVAGGVTLFNRFGGADADLATANPSVFSLDRRLPSTGSGVGASALKLSQQNTTGSVGGGQIGVIRTAALITYDYLVYEEQQITLAPGDWLDLEDGTANDQFFITIIWRERAIEDSEKF